MARLAWLVPWGVGPPPTKTTDQTDRNGGFRSSPNLTGGPTPITPMTLGFPCSSGFGGEPSASPTKPPCLAQKEGKHKTQRGIKKRGLTMQTRKSFQNCIASRCSSKKKTVDGRAGTPNDSKICPEFAYTINFFAHSPQLLPEIAEPLGNAYITPHFITRFKEVGG